MNGGLAAALDIHPRRRYTAHKRQSDKSAAAHIEFCSVLASLGVYTEFGIEPILSTIIGIEDFSVAEISCYYYYVSVSN